MTKKIIKKGDIWVFASSSFGEYYTNRFVERRVGDFQRAAEYYYKNDGYFETPIDLCVAILPYKLTPEESKWVLKSAPYALLVENGWAPAVDEPTYDVKLAKSPKELSGLIKDYINKKGEENIEEIKAGISFDLTKLVKEISTSTRKKASFNLIEKLGL